MCNTSIKFTQTNAEHSRDVTMSKDITCSRKGKFNVNKMLCNLIYRFNTIPTIISQDLFGKK